MGRLTKRDGLIVKTVFESDFGTQNILNRLADYEDLEEQGRLIELPCTVGDVLYKITHPWKQLPKVTKYRVKNFKTIKNGQKLQIEVQADSSPCKSWANFENFYTTKEEAEAKLEELKGGGTDD